MIQAVQLRVGMVIELEGKLYLVEEAEHVKRARGGAFVRTRLKSLTGLENIRKVFSPEERIKDVFVEEKKIEYLYREGDNFHFMDMENFETFILRKEAIGEKLKFLKENQELLLRMYNGKPLEIVLPNFVELKVIRTLPGVKGDTVTSTTKPAVLESGYTLQVPLFIKEGDVVRVDTRTGEYVGKGG